MKEGPLLRGQQYFWFFEHAAPQYNGILTKHFWPVPEGKTANEIRRAFTELVRRHEVLRTTFPIGADGKPLQCVHEPYEVDIHDGTRHEDAAQLARRLMKIPLNLASDWPIKVGLVENTVVLVASHIAIDGISIRVLRGEYEMLLEQCGASLPESPSPIEEATREVDSAATDRYLDTFFDEIPARMFHDYRPGSGLTRATLQLPGSGDATALVARKHNVTPAIVYATAYSVVASLLSGQRRCAFYSAAANRLSDLDRTVGCFFQPALAFADVPWEATLKDVLRELFKAMLRGHRHSRYSYWKMREVMARKAVERGVSFRLAVHFNYMLAGPVPSSQPAALDWRTSPLLWESGVWEDYNTDLYFRIGGPSGDPDTLLLLAHDSVLAKNGIERALRAIAGMIVEWSRSDDFHLRTVTELAHQFDVPATVRTANWIEVDHCWVNTAQLVEVLTAVPDVSSAEIRLHNETELIATVTGKNITSDGLRRHLLAALPDHPDIVVPQQFEVFSRGVRDEPAPLGGDVIREVFERYHGFPLKDLTVSYVLAGGDPERTPAIVSELTRRGHPGLLPDDLLGPRPLEHIASALDRS